MKERLLKIFAAYRWPALTVASLCLFAFALLEQALPLVQAQWQNLQALHELKERLHQAQAGKHLTGILQKQNENWQTRIDQLVSAQNQEVQLSRVLHFLSQAAREHDVQILNLSPQARQSFEQYLELPVALELRAHYHGLGGFMHAIETAPTIIKITSYKMTAPQMTSTNLQVQLRLSIYYLKPRS